jgi:transglutaminase-like putative cysteine protease
MTDPYLEPTPVIESRHPAVVAFAETTVAGASDEADRAVRLFYAVRDGVRYDPYTTALTMEEYRASLTLERKVGFCVPKAILLAASARALGIPSRLGFADVRNHLSTRRLRELLQTDLFVFHGYAELELGGRWVKATPTFNVELCERFGVKPLEFDGRNDSLLQAFDRNGRQHMEYVRDRGVHADLPLEEMVAAWREHYPHLLGTEVLGGDFHAEAEAESRQD